MPSKILCFFFSALFATTAFAIETPENVVSNFIAQLKAQNISGMSDCFAKDFIDQISLEQTASASGGVIPAFKSSRFGPAPILPNEFEIFGKINKINLTSSIYRQIYATTLLTTSPSPDNISLTTLVKSPADVDAFIESIAPTKLGDAKTLQITNPFDDATQLIIENNAKTSPLRKFSRITDRLALIETQGRTFSIPFVLAEEEEKWKILMLGVSSGQIIRTAETTPEEFAEKFVEHKIRIDYK